MKKVILKDINVYFNPTIGLITLRKQGFLLNDVYPLRIKFIVMGNFVGLKTYVTCLK